jgi:putative hydrolase of the HAD superfamily
VWVCERLGVAPGEVVFLDDVPVVVDAAAAFGMHAVLHRGTPESISAISALLPG